MRDSTFKTKLGKEKNENIKVQKPTKYIIMRLYEYNFELCRVMSMGPYHIIINLNIYEEFWEKQWSFLLNSLQ